MSTIPGRLTGEWALVTGATDGRGAAIARRFALEGAAVALTGPDPGAGQRLVAELVTAGATAEHHPADIHHLGQCTDLVAEVVERFGGLTVLVNAAPIPPAAGAHDLDPLQWAEALAVGLTAPAWLCRSAIGEMLDAEHGAIINVTTGPATGVALGHAASTAVAGGLEGLTRSIARDYLDDGIRANSLRAADNATDEDVAEAAVYLAARSTGAVSGSVLCVGS